jgi:radical SAM superfamily enzyme YgiQ (UPF0313 family)
MPTLDELFKKYNIDAKVNPQSGPRSKLLSQADRMLRELAKYKTEQELDGDTTQYWWAPKSVGGKRRVSARYSGKVVEGMAVYPDNTLEDVKATIEMFRKLIEESDDATWANEEERRTKK